MKAFNKLKGDYHWWVGSGKKIHLQTDRWLIESNLCDLLPTIGDIDNKLKVVDINSQGHWDVVNLNIQIRTYILQMIRASPISS